MRRSQVSPVFRSACRLAALCSLAAPALGQSALQTTFEAFDGKPSDIASQKANFTDPSKRAWIAQGRMRMAVRLSDRERMHEEDRTFDLAGSGPEQIVAVEVNEGRVDGKKYLYTLTEGALYRHEISDPTNPTNLAWIPLYDTGPIVPVLNEIPGLAPWEVPVDIKVWNHPTQANRGKIVLLTSKRAILVKDRVEGIGLKSSANELFDLGEGAYMNNTSSTVFNDKLVKEFFQLRIAEDGSGLKAFVTAEMDQRQLSNARGAKLILACDLDQGGNFEEPTFDNDPGSSYFVTSWDPFYDAVPTPPAPPQGAPKSWNDLYTVESLDAIWHASTSIAYVYAACGPENQVQRLDVTNWFASGGIAPTAGFQVFSPKVQPIRNVLADPTIPHRFYALTAGTFRIVLDNAPYPMTPTKRSTIHEPNVHKGSPHDLAFVKSMGTTLDPIETVWTTGDGQADHVCKVLDVSFMEDPGLPPVDLVDEYPAISSSDKSRYVDFGAGGGEIYIPTFGGVLRYTYDAANDAWLSVPDSYATAEENFPGSGVAGNTEHIDYGFHAGGHHVYTIPADGGFMEYKVLPDRSLDANLSVKPDPTKLPPDVFINSFPWLNQWQAWPSGSFYSNDLSFLKIGSQEFVLTILTNSNLLEPDGTTGDPVARYTQHALLAYQWNSVQLQWDHTASQAAASIPYPGLTLSAQNGQSPRLARAVAVAPGLGTNQWFAFVAHFDGFFSVELSGLTTPTPTMPLVSDFNNISGIVRAIAANEDRLFVWVGDDELRIYQWDRMTGVVAPGELNGTEPLGENRYTMDAGGGLVAEAPGRCFRMRFHRDPNGTNGSGHLLTACEPVLLKMAWPGPGGSELPENTLGLADSWSSNYTGELQDCRVYDFSSVYGSGDQTKILVVKNSESFAIVDF